MIDKLLDFIEGSPAHVATAVVGLTLVVMGALGLFVGALAWLSASGFVWLAIIIFIVVMFGGIWFVIYNAEKANW